MADRYRLSWSLKDYLCRAHSPLKGCATVCHFFQTRYLLSFVIAIALIAFSAFLPFQGNLALAEEITGADTSIPTIAYSNGEQQLLAPDWSEISFSKLPPVSEPGWIKFPSKLIKQLGYNPSRVWLAGAGADSFLMLGDVADAFHLEAFNLNDISGLTGLAKDTLNLNDFGLTQWQTPESLVKAIPGLGNLSINKVAPLQDLLSATGRGAGGSIAEVIRANPTFARLPLGELDLTKYNLKSIPGLEKAALGKFSGWQQSALGSVPGLSSVPFSQFPISLLGSSITIATTDLVWSEAEHGDPKVPASLYISGTVNKKDLTVPVPCEADKPCAYIELSDPIGANGAMHGKRWVSGKTQKVKGGFGPLAKVNNGWEPTGKLVFGSAFKVVLTDTNEQTGSANFALYFRACVNIPFYGKSCTPYFIGGIPWFPTQEKGFVIVATAKPNVDIPSKYRGEIAAIEQQYAPPAAENTNDSVVGSNTLCGKGPGRVDLKALADATSSIEGNYNSIGKWGCDGAGNCGRGLGRYQLMTYRSDVRQAIASQPGGREFYARLSSGHSPSVQELNQYFSPEAQDKLFASAQTANINHLLKRGKSGDGLIACLGQMWYSGSCSNSNGRDYIGGPTIRQYGQKLVNSYRKATANGTSRCAIASTSGSGTATGKLTNPSPNSPITSEFGRREKPCEGCSSDHKGIDIGIGNGTPVKAADGGTVVYAGTAKGYGNVLVIDHGNGLQTRYAHLEGFSAKVGTKVSPQQVVATADSTGVGTGAHLHFEVRENASADKYPFDQSIRAVNPRKYVKF